jgi:carnitine O-acetyltransferase
LAGLVGATYESISTRQYQHGRTEAMRVVTPEVIGLVAAMDDPMVDAVTRRARFRAAAAKHAERAKECQAGQAPEQYLWELQLIQRRRGAEVGVTDEPELYASPGWLIMRVAYVLLPDRFNLYLSMPSAVAGEMFTFAGQLRNAVRELQDLLAGE